MRLRTASTRSSTTMWIDVVDECLNQIAARFEGATVHSFIPLLIRRYVREEIQTRLRQT